MLYNVIRMCYVVIILVVWNVTSWSLKLKCSYLYLFIEYYVEVFGHVLLGCLLIYEWTIYFKPFTFRLIMFVQVTAFETFLQTVIVVHIQNALSNRCLYIASFDYVLTQTTVWMDGWLDIVCGHVHIIMYGIKHSPLKQINYNVLICRSCSQWKLLLSSRLFNR